MCIIKQLPVDLRYINCYLPSYLQLCKPRCIPILTPLYARSFPVGIRAYYEDTTDKLRGKNEVSIQQVRRRLEVVGVKPD